MEQRNNLVLQGTETFSRGQLDNVALDNGSVVLDSVAGRYLQYGSYTTPEFAMPAFCNLNVSWNAHAPQNTMVAVRRDKSRPFRQRHITHATAQQGSGRAG